ncbi:unnamed protein product [Acanthosepion pharaonis]|uniref:Uncharacterized protein n=1 Tax=Acanthosepion pharaonis TaxID=158019 RepID=A0A812EU92_ACAPH|nr:unnamed protein product [Sepia pharaonis]
MILLLLLLYIPITSIFPPFFHLNAHHATSIHLIQTRTWLWPLLLVLHRNRCPSVHRPCRIGTRLALNLFFSPASSSHSHTHLSSLSSISSSFFLLDFNFPSPFAQANSIHDEPVQSRKARVHYRTLDWTSSGLLSLRPVPKRLPRASGRKVHTRHENGFSLVFFCFLPEASFLSVSLSPLSQYTFLSLSQPLSFSRISFHPPHLLSISFRPHPQFLCFLLLPTHLQFTLMIN